MANSLANFTSREVNRFDVLDEIIRRLLERDKGLDCTRQSIANRFREKCYLTGQRVALNQSGTPVEGVCRGVDECGRLLVDVGDQLRAVQSGEATLVRRRSVSP